MNDSKFITSRTAYLIIIFVLSLWLGVGCDSENEEQEIEEQEIKVLDTFEFTIGDTTTVFNFNYDENRQLQSITDEESAITVEYSNDKLSKISSEDNYYTYKYNDNGNITEIAAYRALEDGGEQIIQQRFNYYYNSNGQVKELEKRIYNSDAALSYTLHDEFNYPDNSSKNPTSSSQYYKRPSSDQMILIYDKEYTFDRFEKPFYASGISYTLGLYHISPFIDWEPDFVANNITKAKLVSSDGNDDYDFSAVNEYDADNDLIKTTVTLRHDGKESVDSVVYTYKVI